jgi:hypothetical protein
VDALPALALFLIAVIAVAVLVDGLIRRVRLRRVLERAWREVPRDAETGLFDRRACLQRIAAELKRAARSEGTVWVGIVTVVEGDADRFGRLLNDSLRVPEVAFRLSDQVVCVTRPDLTEAEREDLIGRIVASGPRERLALGEQRWAGTTDGTAADVLRRATNTMREVEA